MFLDKSITWIKKVSGRIAVNQNKSSYSTFIITRGRYVDREKKSIVGAAIIVRPSWDRKSDTNDCY